LGTDILIYGQLLRFEDTNVFKICFYSLIDELEIMNMIAL